MDKNQELRRKLKLIDLELDAVVANKTNSNIPINNSKNVSYRRKINLNELKESVYGNTTIKQPMISKTENNMKLFKKNSIKM